MVVSSLLCSVQTVQNIGGLQITTPPPASSPAATITTSWTTISVPAAPDVAPAQMPAYWARPAASEAKPRAGVLVLPEVFGVNGWVRRVAERLAAEGYAALAISTFARTAPHLEAGYDDAGLALGREHRDQVRASQLLADVAAAARWLQQAHSADGLAAKPLGCVGFCFGGHLAMLAATLPEIAATCDFYGARVASFRPGGGLPTLELVPQIPGRLWCFCGDADPLMPPDEVAAISHALQQANAGEDPASPQARHQLHIAAGAGHGYMCDARADFQLQAAAAGWSAMLQLFAEAL